VNCKAISCILIFCVSSAAQAENSQKKKPVMTVEDALRRLAEDGASLPPGPLDSPAVAAKKMVSFGRCIMSAPGSAGDILATLPGSAEERLIAGKIAKRRSGCLNSGALRFGPAILRGVIAEGFLRRDFSSIGGAAKRLAVKIYTMPEQSKWASLSSQAPLQLQSLAACVVTRAPAKVSEVLIAVPATDREDAAWKQLSVDLNDCIDPAQSLKITKLQLRGVLAEAGYRLSVATMQASITR
jgi:hypothetical protein